MSTTPEQHPEHTEALLLRDAMIAGLAGAAADLTDVGERLYRASVLTKIQRIVLFSILGIVLVTLIGLTAIALQNRTNGGVVRDCTDPQGQCYQRNTAQTNVLIQELIQESEAASWCSPRSKTITAYRACIGAFPK